VILFRFESHMRERASGKLSGDQLYCNCTAMVR
jgi:hypothetical protein